MWEKLERDWTLGGTVGIPTSISVIKKKEKNKTKTRGRKESEAVGELKNKEPGFKESK